MPDLAADKAGQPACDTFHDDLLALLPKLRVQALALTRNRSQADDLVQETVVRALAGRDSFQPGTNFAAWMHRILRNNFISDIRKRRDQVPIDDAPAAILGRMAEAMDRIALQELWAAMGRLSAEYREALMMVAVENMSYEQVAEATGVAVGTAKCRVFRARNQLHAMLLGADEPATRRPRLNARAPRLAPVVNAASADATSGSRHGSSGRD